MVDSCLLEDVVRSLRHELAMEQLESWYKGAHLGLACLAAVTLIGGGWDEVLQRK